MPRPNPMALSPETRYQVLIADIAEYDEKAMHYEQESIKLQRWRAKRLEQIRKTAERRGEVTPYVSLEPELVARSWAGDDPKLTEYAAGMAIVERRATMYAQMAASLRMQLILDRFAQGLSITGTLTK